MKTLSALGLVLALGGVAAADTTKDVAALEDCLSHELQLGHQPYVCIDYLSEPCMDSPEGGTTFGMTSCLSEEHAAWDVMLNSTYKDLKAKLDDRQNRALRTAQRAWITYRDEDCKLPRVLIEGTLATPWSAACVRDHTARRVIELRDYLGVFEQ